MAILEHIRAKRAHNAGIKIKKLERGRKRTKKSSAHRGAHRRHHHHHRVQVPPAVPVRARDVEREARLAAVRHCTKHVHPAHVHHVEAALRVRARSGAAADTAAALDAADRARVVELRAAVYSAWAFCCCCWERWWWLPLTW